MASGEKLEIQGRNEGKSGVEKIGNINGFIFYDLESASLYDDSDYLNLQLIFKSDEIEKPDAKKKLEKSKSNDWKTIKILKRLKGLKRYRIVKKLKNLKILK